MEGSAIRGESPGIHRTVSRRAAFDRDQARATISRQIDRHQDAHDLAGAHRGYGDGRGFDIVHKFLASPTPRAALVLGKALGGGVRGMVQAAVVIALAALQVISHLNPLTYQVDARCAPCCCRAFPAQCPMVSAPTSSSSPRRLPRWSRSAR
ncbi:MULTISPECIES: hypothetical protein [Burkholderia]|uniref:hypothetical protein n=1 Tax=Burkholderia TaxID=32008 RepID=UPI001582DE15|nr:MULTISPECIES: hypothetical protein [Burkholderia]